jgi:tetratricopeptide (TPR) repeat protein
VKTKRSRPLTISLCVIARDEERFIGDCIDSAKPWVQEVIVLDTGSRDRTREIAREHGARVEQFTWCDDFAAARNAAIDVATTDWILMLDADERLDPEGAELLGHYASMAPVIPNGINAFCPLIVSQTLDGVGGRSVASRVMRFFPRMRDLRWVGAIHEDLQYVPEPLRLRSIALDRVRIVHYGYDSTVYVERGKDARNTRLLEQEIQRHPEDARTLYFLGQQHAAMGRDAAAIPYFQSFLKRADQSPHEFTVQVFAMLIKALATVGDVAGVEEVTRRGEEHKLLSADAREALATFEERRARLDLAEQHLLRALEPGQPVGVTADEGIGSWATRLHLAQVREGQGYTQRALQDLDAAFADLPQRQRGHVAVESAALALRCTAYELAEQWLERAAKYVDATSQVQQRLMEMRIDLFKHYPQAAARTDQSLALEVAVAGEDWQTAYDAALSLDVEAPGSIGRLLHVASGLKQAGGPDAALDVLDRALQAPDLPQSAYWLLLSTLTEVGRFEDADATVELMRLRGIAPARAKAA